MSLSMLRKHSKRWTMLRWWVIKLRSRFRLGAESTTLKDMREEREWEDVGRQKVMSVTTAGKLDTGKCSWSFGDCCWRWRLLVEGSLTVLMCRATECKNGDWSNKCYKCGKNGHLKKDCERRSNSPTPRDMKRIAIASRRRRRHASRSRSDSYER